ncbi:MAG: APC family permease [Gemmatimonadota bacterium]
MTPAPPATRGPAELERRLGLYDATMIVMGSIIGSGIFLVSAGMARQLGSPGWLLVAWAISGLLAIAGALSYAELAAMMPRAGGSYVYLREAFSPIWGFLFGWTFLLVVQTGSIAAVAVAFARFLGVLAPGIAEDRYLIEPVPLVSRYAISLSTAQLVAITLILLLTWANTRGLGPGTIIQNIFASSNVATLAALIVAGLALGLGSAAANANFSDLWTVQNPEAIVPGVSAVTAFGLVVALLVAQVGSFFSTTGWDNLAYAAGEVRHPERTLPLALALGVGLAMTLYLLVNVAYLSALPIAAIQQAPGDRVASAAFEALWPGVGALVIAGAVVIATFGANNAMIMAGARIYYAMARDGLFFEPAGRLNRARVPGWSLALQGAWAAALVLPRTARADGSYGSLYGDLLDYATFALLLFYALSVACVYRLRRTRPGPRAGATPGYPVTPAIFLAGAGAIMLALVVYRPYTTWLGLGLVLLGIPVYFLWRRFDSGSGRSAPLATRAPAAPSP